MKTYLRYESSTSFGSICSPRSPCLLLPNHTLLTANGDVALRWDLHRSQAFRSYSSPHREEISCLGASDRLVVLGTVKGRIVLLEEKDGTARATLWGHRGAVSCIAFDAKGERMATGSRDTFVVVWDPVAEVGLFRLRGHKDLVTDLRFWGDGGVLVSAAKDATMRVWDLEAQRCVKVVVEHPHAVWCVEVVEDRKRVFTGSSDGLIRSFEVVESQQGGVDLKIMPGALNRQTTERSETLVVCQGILAVQSAGHVVEFYRIRSMEQALKKQKRRLKRLREKNAQPTVEDEMIQTQDELELACVLRTAKRARSVAMRVDPKTKEHLVLISYTDNFVEVYVLKTVGQEEDDEDGEPAADSNKKLKREKVSTSLEIKTRLELQGHRTDIRCVSLGDDDSLILSAADGALKLWNVETSTCVRTMQAGFVLCSAFVQDGAYCVAGTKQGSLTLYELSTGVVVKTIENAHAAGDDEAFPVYSMDVRPDGRSLVTAGGDKTCKFWDLGTNKKGEFSLVHKRTLKLGEDAQCVRYTKGAKKQEQLKVCVALLDSTIKVFHEDSLEFSLSLYGHKLPVLTMDCSDDGALLASGSTDKSIKIWGLDFGDCHRSVFAHDGSVTCVRFVPKTHYLLSCGRDGRVRYWDCDANMDRILSFDNYHIGDLWGLAVARDGSFFVSAGKDKQVRRFDRTRDLVFLDEERAKEVEQKLDEEEEEMLRDEQTVPLLNVDSAPDGTSTLATDSLSVAKKTMDGMEAVDRMIEVLAGASADSDWQTIGKSLADFSRSLPAQDLQDAISFLPFTHVVSALRAYSSALALRLNIELCAKSVITLTKIHAGRLSAGKEYRALMEELAKNTREALWEMRDLYGTNTSRLRYAAEW